MREDIKNVYLAGKIYQYDWREEITGFRGNSIDIEIDDDIFYKNLYNFSVASKWPTIKVVGPTFIACEHGCSYSSIDFAHALGASDIRNQESYDCIRWQTDIEVPSYTQVKEVCFAQIDRADIVFINLFDTDRNPFGTLTEIGFAKALDKKLVFLFDEERTKEKYSYLLDEKSTVYIGESLQTIFDDLDKMPNIHTLF